MEELARNALRELVILLIAVVCLSLALGFSDKLSRFWSGFLIGMGAAFVAVCLYYGYISEYYDEMRIRNGAERRRRYEEQRIGVPDVQHEGERQEGEGAVERRADARLEGEE